MDILGCLSEKICIFPDFLETLFSASHIYMNTKKVVKTVYIYIYICNLNILNSLHIFANVHLTARKRSLGQGNIFRSMCPSFCPEGVGGGHVWQGGIHGRGYAWQVGCSCRRDSH